MKVVLVFIWSVSIKENMTKLEMKIKKLKKEAGVWIQSEKKMGFKKGQT